MIKYIITPVPLQVFCTIIFGWKEMLKFKLKELIAKKEFDEGRQITIKEIAEKTSINRMTLSKIINHKGYSTVTDNINSLCHYFDCEISDLVEYVEE